MLAFPNFLCGWHFALLEERVYNQGIKGKSVYPAVLIADSTDGARVFYRCFCSKPGWTNSRRFRFSVSILLIYSTLADGFSFEFSNFPLEVSSHK